MTKLETLKEPCPIVKVKFGAKCFHKNRSINVGLQGCMRGFKSKEMAEFAYQLPKYSRHSQQVFEAKYSLAESSIKDHTSRCFVLLKPFIYPW